MKRIFILATVLSTFPLFADDLIPMDTLSVLMDSQVRDIIGTPIGWLFEKYAGSQRVKVEGSLVEYVINTPFPSYVFVRETTDGLNTQERRERICYNIDISPQEQRDLFNSLVALYGTPSKTYSYVNGYVWHDWDNFKVARFFNVSFSPHPNGILLTYTSNIR